MGETVVNFGYLWRIIYLCFAKEVKTMGKRVPRFLFDKYKMIGTVVFSVLFSIVYLNVSMPFSPTTWFILTNPVNFLITAGFVVITILFLGLSRYLLYRYRLLRRVTYMGYFCWCSVEIVIIALIYTWITRNVFINLDPQSLLVAKIPPRETFGIVFGRSILNGIICLIIPNVITMMYFIIADKNQTIKILAQRNVVTDDSPSEKGETIFTMYDIRGALKLSVRSSNLYYVESDDNYIKAWYTDNSGELKVYMIRCRLKTIEDNFRGTSLMRCHRQYIVNTDKVKIVRKNQDGFFLELDHDKISPIPVTKTYAANVTKQFSDKIETRS